jgi:hypothetical protein
MELIISRVLVPRNPRSIERILPLSSTNYSMPDIPRVGTGAAWMSDGGACAVLVPLPIQHPIVARTLPLLTLEFLFDMSYH